MGALDMGLTEDELQPLVTAWRQANPHIVQFWWDIDRAATEAVRDKRICVTHGIKFYCQSAMLFIVLPSGRQLTYVKPRIGENQFGGHCITYEAVSYTHLDVYKRQDGGNVKTSATLVESLVDGSSDRSSTLLGSTI